jgi:hypothetical protein
LVTLFAAKDQVFDCVVCVKELACIQSMLSLTLDQFDMLGMPGEHKHAALPVPSILTKGEGKHWSLSIPLCKPRTRLS